MPPKQRIDVTTQAICARIASIDLTLLGTSFSSLDALFDLISAPTKNQILQLTQAEENFFRGIRIPDGWILTESNKNIITLAIRTKWYELLQITADGKAPSDSESSNSSGTTAEAPDEDDYIAKESLINKIHEKILFNIKQLLIKAAQEDTTQKASLRRGKSESEKIRFLLSEEAKSLWIKLELPEFRNLFIPGNSAYDENLHTRWNENVSDSDDFTPVRLSELFDTVVKPIIQSSTATLENFDFYLPPEDRNLFFYIPQMWDNLTRQKNVFPEQYRAIITSIPRREYCALTLYDVAARIRNNSVAFPKLILDLDNQAMLDMFIKKDISGKTIYDVLAQRKSLTSISEKQLKEDRIHEFFLRLLQIHHYLIFRKGIVSMFRPETGYKIREQDFCAILSKIKTHFSITPASSVSWDIAIPADETQSIAGTEVGSMQSSFTDVITAHHHDLLESERYSITERYRTHRTALFSALGKVCEISEIQEAMQRYSHYVTERKKNVGLTPQESAPLNAIAGVFDGTYRAPSLSSSGLSSDTLARRNSTATTKQQPPVASVVAQPYSASAITYTK